MTVNYRFYILAMLLFWLAVCPRAWADDDTVVPIQSYLDEADVRIQLQALVNNFGFYRNNHLCIIAYKSKDDGTVVPYVYWPTQNKLIAWGFGSNLLIGSTNYFDLLRDIVPSPADIPPQDFILPWTRADVDSLVQDCKAHGKTYTIIKTEGGWVPINKFSQFSSVTAQLQYLVDQNASTKTNVFCVIGQRDGPFLGAYVYWRTMEQLIFWYPDPNDAVDPINLAYSEVKIDLQDGLRDQEDAASNRNEMQKSYAEGILKACQNLGQTFIINKSN